LAADVIGNTFSRYEENQADVYSLEVTHGIVPDPARPSRTPSRPTAKPFSSILTPSCQRLPLFDHPPVSDRIHLGVTYDPWSKGESPQFVK